MKNIFKFAMSKPTVFVYILHINLNEDVFFSSATLFLLCWLQKVKHILYFDKTNKNNKSAIFKFLDKLAYIIKNKKFLSVTNYYVDNKM